VKRIEMARSEGDLKENGGYHAAKDEQGKIEARIRELTDMLKHAHVGSEPVDASEWRPAQSSTAHIHGDEENFLLGSREVAGDTDLDVYSENSPWAKLSSGSSPATRPPSPHRAAPKSRSRLSRSNRSSVRSRRGVRKPSARRCLENLRRMLWSSRLDVNLEFRLG